MTKDTHTPGPWVADLGEAFHIRDPQGGRIAQLIFMAGKFGFGGRRDGDEVAANARLIAAAPDLLEAASALIDDVKRRYPNEELRCEFMLALDAAIAKARGQS